MITAGQLIANLTVAFFMNSKVGVVSGQKREGGRRKERKVSGLEL